jgi:hypothetical protein
MSSVDFASCRHVVDIVADPIEFTRMIQRTLGPQTIFYCEVPRAQHTFTNRIAWNVVYEHNIWFTEESFRYFLEAAGFEVLRTAPCWRDEYLGIDARVNRQVTPRAISAETYEQLIDMLRGFSADTLHLRQSWARQLAKMTSSGKRVALWGAGARGITFLTEIPQALSIGAIIDINPARQGKFIPRSGHRVDAPSYLTEFKPDVVIISNPTYAEEIRRDASALCATPPLFLSL